MPDVTPIRFTSAATPVDRSIVRPAQGMGDQYRQVSWLTAQAPLLRLPDIGSGVIRQWLFGLKGLLLTVAGAAMALDLRQNVSSTDTMFPFHLMLFSTKNRHSGPIGIR